MGGPVVQGQLVGSMVQWTVQGGSLEGQEPPLEIQPLEKQSNDR